MKAIIFSNIPSPYFVRYLEELSVYIDVTAVFERKTAADRDKSWYPVSSKMLKVLYLNGINTGTESAFSPGVISVIRKNRDAVLIFADPFTPTGLTGIVYCKSRGIPYVLQSEGGMPKSGKGIREQIKHWIVSGAALCLSGMKPENDYFRAYGAKKENIRWYPFASLAESDMLSEIPTDGAKEELRKKLKIPYSKMILYVGRIIQRKGIDVLIRALRGMDSDAGVYLVGGAETEDLKKLAESLDVVNLEYIPFLALDQLKQYYMAADLFVLPTRDDTWGLVINEAMSFGLPVITTDRCVAGMELIESGVNGYLVESEDSESMSRCMEDLLNTPELRRRMGALNLKKIRSYTFENMAGVIYQSLAGYSKQ